jgi:hypothetical protein
MLDDNPCAAAGPVQGALPTEWVAVGSAWGATLHTLELANSGATLSVPTAWGLASLTQCDLSGNSGITGALFQILAGSPLQYLDVSGCSLSADWSTISGAPAELMPAIQVLKISNNTGIVGSLPAPAGREPTHTPWCWQVL